ncbi:MAG: aldo/keto reductase [Bacillota bacterium]|nr:aldo/keto reductase [Bacillota bacterium]
MSIDLAKMPKLGFGLMRLPSIEEEVDIEQVNRMVDAYLEKGFNYFDTAYVYGGGKSECSVKEALVKRHPRESFMVATKLPAWELKTEADVERIFNTQLERTGAGYFDFYLLHSIEEGNIGRYDEFNCWQWAMKKKEEGLIKHFGFSFHDSPELLDKVLTEHPEVEFVQLQINYADWTNKIVQSGKNYEVARKHNVPIIVMEPVKGGMLAAFQPELESMLKNLRPDSSIASWALRFVASQEGIMTILSGMSSMEQMEDNLKTMSEFEPLSKEESDCLEVVTEKLLSAPTIQCTACRYCVDGCPQGIKIPDIFRAFNTIKTYGEDMRPHFFYGGLTSDGHTASTCIQCGQCESVCPQHLEIINYLSEASEVFDKR